MLVGQAIDSFFQSPFPAKYKTRRADCALWPPRGHCSFGTTLAYEYDQLSCLARAVQDLKATSLTTSRSVDLFHSSRSCCRGAMVRRQWMSDRLPSPPSRPAGPAGGALGPWAPGALGPWGPWAPGPVGWGPRLGGPWAPRAPCPPGPQGLRTHGSKKGPWVPHGSWAGPMGRKNGWGGPMGLGNLLN